ncbi:hypothetical protein amrb99_51420 [Actinomadura sp. RB99]|uniref:SAF domain-containing protein n=1 Tax=Actinomadura sp. RB99 TaxID=2691577 RepID=UPI001685243C|nr:hypothetical protein [Actinomadura sp. RB99]
MAFKRLPRQRRPGMLLAAAMLVLFAVATNVYLFVSSGNRVSVVKVARDVAADHEITQADLERVRVAVEPGVEVIPAHQLDQVVGRRAAMPLRRGTLLAASQLSTQQSPPAGRTLVGMSLKPGSMPPGLASGWKVRVVFTAGAQGQDAGAGAEQGRAESVVARDVAAVVDQVDGPDTEGATTVSLMVPEADSSTVARQAAAGMVVLVATERQNGT